MGYLRTTVFVVVFATFCPLRVSAQADDDATKSGDPVGVLEQLRPQDGGMTAERAARMAIQRAPVVARASAVVAQAEAQAAREKMRLIPRLDLSGKARKLSHITLPDLNFGGMTVENPFPYFTNRYELEADLTFPVTDVFLGLLPAYRAAEGVAEFQRYQKRAETQDIAYRARLAFYDVILAHGAELVAQDSVSVLESGVDDIQALADAGVATQADVERTQAQLASVRVRLARARAGRSVAEARLRQLVAGGEEVEVFSGEDVFAAPTHDVPEVAELVRIAMDERPELKALRRLAGVRRDAKSAKRSETMPKLDLYGAALYANPNPLIIPPQQKFRGTWEVGVVLHWSPNDSLTGRRNVQAAEQEVRQAMEDLRALEDGVVVEVAQARANYQAALEAVTAAKDGLEAAQTSFRNRRDLLAAGEATTSEVLETEQDLRGAQLDLVDAYVAVRRSLADIDKAIGRAEPDDARTAQYKASAPRGGT